MEPIPNRHDLAGFALTVVADPKLRLVVSHPEDADGRAVAHAGRVLAAWALHELAARGPLRLAARRALPLLSSRRDERSDALPGSADR